MARYKITLDFWLNLFEKQNHKCATCRTPVHSIMGKNDKDRGVIDHDHATGRIRGILCHNCNRALGLIKDNEETLKRMVKYLNE